MKNFIYSSILMGCQLNNINLPAPQKTPVKMPTSSVINERTIVDKRQGYGLILDLPYHRDQSRRSNNNPSSFSITEKKHIDYRETIMGCNYKAMIEKVIHLDGEIDREHLYNYLAFNNSTSAMIN
jgi:hypothetical protein